MNIQLTMLGQLISFVLFVLFCMKFVWPHLTAMMRERQQTIAAGLDNAAAAEKQLAEAGSQIEADVAAAKQQSAELITQARKRASQIVEASKAQASEEAERIIQGAQAEIDQEVNRAKEALRVKVGELAIEGAEKILEAQVDPAKHQAMLSQLAKEL